jgi:maltose O-acetyltransferase
MTEREKMLLGKIYDPFTEGLPEERSKAHRLCKLYNDTFETDLEKRKEILDELIPNRGKNVYLQGPIYFDFGTNTAIGEGSYANFNFTVLDICPVTIGKFVFIGPNVSLLTPKHPLCHQDRNPYFNKKTGTVTDMEYGAPITIGDNCWIAGNVTICAGVTIGEGCVIGAGAVVTRDIPAGSLAFGNPCRVVRAITEADCLSAHPELFTE